MVLFCEAGKVREGRVGWKTENEIGEKGREEERKPWCNQRANRKAERDSMNNTSQLTPTSRRMEWNGLEWLGSARLQSMSRVFDNERNPLLFRSNFSPKKIEHKFEHCFQRTAAQKLSEKMSRNAVPIKTSHIIYSLDLDTRVFSDLTTCNYLVTVSKDWIIDRQK